MDTFWIIIIVIIAFIAIKSIIRALESPEKKVARKFMKRFRLNRRTCVNDEAALTITTTEMILDTRFSVSTGLPGDQYLSLVFAIRHYVSKQLTSY